MELVIVTAGFVLAIAGLAALFYLRRAVVARGEVQQLEEWPSVTVIRPIKGLDAGAQQNIEAALNPNYPGAVETLFVFDDEDEPAVPLVREVVRRHEGTAEARIMFCGQPPANRTGKLNAMIAGLREARHQLVAFADSDIRPRPGALTALVSRLMTSSGAGSAFAPVVASQPPLTVGDAGYSLLLNGLYGPTAAALSRIEGGELPFIMGQYMIFKREAIEAIGGLERAEGQLVDDMYIGALVKAAGFRNMVTPTVVPIIQEKLSLREFFKTYQRWITFSRSGLTQWSFRLISWLPGVVFWLGLVGLVVSLIGGYWLAAVLNSLAPLTVSTSVNILHRKRGGAPLPLRLSWLSFALLVVTPAVLLSTYIWRNVNWRGRSYQLDVHSRLAEGDVPAADRLPTADTVGEDPARPLAEEVS